MIVERLSLRNTQALTMTDSMMFLMSALHYSVNIIRNDGKVFLLYFGIFAAFPGIY